MKAGDEVWVKARVECARGERVQLLFGGKWILWLPSSDCRPVEPPPDISKMGVEIVSESGVRSVKKPVAAETWPDLNFYRTLSYDDILQEGDIFFESNTLEFRKVEYTIGTRVTDVFTAVRDNIGSTLTFYRPV